MNETRIVKKTKIVATIGPASQDPKIMANLAMAGLDVIRLNMSHGDHDTHAMTLASRAKAQKITGKTIAALVDLSGPKIRIGDFADGVVELVTGERLVLTPEKVAGTTERVHINYPTLAKELQKGSIIMLDDGKKKLEVIGFKGDDVITTVLVGGTTKGRRGVNLPGANLSISAVTAKDKKDAAWGLQQDIDYIALSFVRSPRDIKDLRKIINAHKSDVKIIAKIETPEAVDCINDIIAESDGIMVARGDLAIEIGPENVPRVQKEIIRLCKLAGKPVITATQMLESMINTPTPTRAEVSDVANAIYDGTDAVMLSEETALGKYPLETVSMMARICANTESSIGTHRRMLVQHDNIADSISSSVAHVAENAEAKAIVALTESGFTARMIARYRSIVPVYSVSPHRRVASQNALLYGVTPIIQPAFKSFDDALKKMSAFVIKNDIAKKGDRIILSAGLPLGTVGGTNMMMIVTI